MPASAPSGLRVLVATLASNAYLALGSAVFAVLSLAVAWVPPRPVWVFRVARVWARGILLASGVRLDVAFDHPPEPGRPVVYMANHQSLLDIPALLVSLPGPTSLLAKRSLFRIPVFGWAMRAAGFLSIDRDDRSRVGRTFAAAVDRLQAGTSALIFPEGTRSEDGLLGPFQRGGVLLALKSGLPIVPVGLSGAGALQPAGSRRVRPGVVRVTYGEPIETAGRGVRDRLGLADEVRGRIAALAGCELR